MGFDEAITMKELGKAVRQCKKGVADKDAPVEWYCHSLTKTKKLKDSITSGRYKARPGHKVEIYRPKRRTATAPYFRDRVWQRSMCNNGVYDDITRPFILDNIACQKGKGMDLAIRRLVRALQKLHRTKPGAPIYVVHLDVRKFFPSTPHRCIKEMDRRIISDPRFIPYLDEIIDSSKDERPREEIEADPFGERGTGLGSQINQLHQVALLDRLDHELKTFCRFYIRYNDDFLILDHDKDIVKRAEAVIERRLKDLGLEMTNKSGITTAQHGFTFLRKRFLIQPEGKIIIRLHSKALAEERQALRRLKRDLDAGLIDMDHVKRHYQSVIAGWEYAGDAPIRAMDKFYTELFRAHPEYKRKKRYLYGKENQARRDQKDADARARKHETQSRER